MKLVSMVILGLSVGASLFAQEQPARVGGDKTATLDAQEALEKKFKETLTNAEFVGRWCLIENGIPGPEREEKYTLLGANKVSTDLWVIHARVQYGQKDVTVPVPVAVKWAGDTPVITLTDANIPNLGTYTARVVVYNGTYAGTWSGGKHAGLLHGVIRPKAAEKKD